LSFKCVRDKFACQARSQEFVMAVGANVGIWGGAPTAGGHFAPANEVWGKPPVAGGIGVWEQNL